MDNVTLSDQFDDSQGQLPNYDAYDTATRLHVINQKHIDIRSFNNNAQQTEWRMLDLDQTTMDDLDPLTMDDLEGAYAYVSGENWTVGTAGPESDRNHWPGLSMECTAATTTTTESVIPIATLPSEVEAVDLLTFFENDDFISLALPDFPLGDIDLENSWLDLTSHVSGNFASGPVASLRLDASTIPLVAGNSEYRRLRSAITGINLQHVTGVRIRIAADNTCTFRAMALRLLSKDWAYTQLDIDTRLEVMRPTVAPNASPARAYDFAFPALFRTGTPAGVDDPKPIDISIGVPFNTGSMDATNQIRLYFREGPGDFTTMLDLDSKTMEELNGLPQPDITTDSFRSRTQAELDLYVQSDLDTDEQQDIERTIDSEITSYITAFLQWTAVGTAISLLNSEGVGYSFLDVDALDSNSSYIFIVDLEDTTLRARLYPLDLSGNILLDEMVFDTSTIYDSFAYVRRAGRFGWTATLGDGDASIDAITTRRQIYAEFQTAAYGSLTPVIGAELHVAGSPKLEFFDALDVGSFVNTNTVITRDRTRSTSGLSWRVDNPGTVAPQGIQTNLADFYDFDEMEITFDLYYPKTAINAGIVPEAYLSNEQGRIISIPLGKILPDRWQSFKISPGGRTAQTGRYSFHITQNVVGIPSTWWIDNIHITERTLSFYARSVAADPWGDTEAEWVPFKNHINKDATGVQFQDRGRSLQILGRAHRQSARIDNIKVVPQYAQLGRFVWEEDELYNPQAPTSLFDCSSTGLTILFDGLESTDPDGDIINYRWNFGDGNTAIGPVVLYTYTAAGSYFASLVVTDTNGLQASSTQEVVVT